tara:strand:+ start:832 stop:1524 length:693 start_codon:yes stop_codon:yes gene_type:complete
MHYYKKHVKDYIADTSHLTMLQHGAYNILIDTYILREKPLSLDKEELYWSISARSDEEKAAIDLILKHFFVETEDGYYHKRIESELQNYIEIGERSKINGKLGGRPKNKPRNNPGGDPRNNPDITLTTNHKPLTNNHIDLFKEFWDNYPHRSGNKKTKKDSMNWWNKQSLDTLTIVLKEVKNYKKYIEKCHNDKVFDGGVPDPIRYLKNERYLDELDVKQTNSAFAGGYK